MKKPVISILSTLAGAALGAGAVGKVALDKTKKVQLMSDKHLALFLMMNQWVKVKQEGKSLAVYFETNGFKKIAIYGMSYMGERLAYELNDSNIEVLYGIDKDAKKKNSDIPVFLQSELPERVDIIINTTVFENTCLLEELNLKGILMMNMNELFDAVNRSR